MRRFRSGNGQQKVRTELRASMTVEAALVLPVFLFAVTAFLYLFQLIYIQQGIQAALYQTVSHFSKNAYLYEEILDNFSELQNDDLTRICDALNVSEAVTSFIYEDKFKAYLEESNCNYAVIEGGRDGISIQAQSDYFDDQEVDICAYYTCKIPVLFFQIDPIDCIQRAKGRNWTGQSAVCRYGQVEQETGEESTTGEEVYMTVHGTRYHTHRDCTHLTLSVRNTTYGEMLNLKNKNNRRYTACSLCAEHASFVPGSTVYVTDEGLCYHTSRQCSGLRRTITTYRRNQIPDGTPCCKRCQKRDEQAANSGESD